jgi:SprT-like family
VLAFPPVPWRSSLPSHLVESLDRWLQLWNVPHLEAKSRIEWSPRLTRSLGRCYPDKRLIRMASYLESAPDGLLQEVLCHEMAHLAARELHGRNVRPHGPDWKALMTSAGYEPRTRLPSPNEPRGPEENTGPPTSTSTAAPSASSSERRAAS